MNKWAKISNRKKKEKKIYIYAVPEKWSLFKEKVLNKDFSTKMGKNGPYLVLLLSKSPYFPKSVCEKNYYVSFAGFLSFS